MSTGFISKLQGYLFNKSNISSRASAIFIVLLFQTENVKVLDLQTLQSSQTSGWNMQGAFVVAITLLEIITVVQTFFRNMSGDSRTFYNISLISRISPSIFILGSSSFGKACKTLANILFTSKNSRSDVLMDCLPISLFISWRIWSILNWSQEIWLRVWLGIRPTRFRSPQSFNFSLGCLLALKD